MSKSQNQTGNNVGIAPNRAELRHPDQREQNALRPWMNKRECAAETGLSVSFWDHAVQRGEIKYAKIGAAVRINRAVLAEFMEARAVLPLSGKGASE